MSDQDQKTSTIPASFRTTIAIIEKAWGFPSEEWGLLGPVEDKEYGKNEPVIFRLNEEDDSDNYYQLFRIGDSGEPLYIALDATFGVCDIEEVYNTTPENMKSLTD